MRVRRPGRRSVMSGASVAGVAGLAWLCADRADEVGAAFSMVSSWALGGLLAIHLVTLVLRTEAWRTTLAAIEGLPPARRAVHGANAAAFAVGSVQSHASLPVRVAMLRRLAPETSPLPGQIAVADVPIVLLEVAGTCLLVTAAALVAVLDTGPDRVPAWTAAAALALGAGLLLAGRLVLRGGGVRPLARGLAILGDRSLRGRLAVLVGGICALGALRVWAALAVVGLPHGVEEVAVVVSALGGLGLLPLGPASTPAATIGALGATDVGAALAAGLALSATSIAAVLVYAAAVGLVSVPRAVRAAAGLRPVRGY